MKEMDESKYVTPTELREIADICERLDMLRAFQERCKHAHIDVLSDKEGWGGSWPVYDGNGESLGRIGFGDSSYVLYLDTTDEL